MVTHTDLNYCKHCGSTLGIDCGEAEPDFSEHYCSKGCFKVALECVLFGDASESRHDTFILEF